MEREEEAIIIAHRNTMSWVTKEINICLEYLKVMESLVLEQHRTNVLCESANESYNGEIGKQYMIIDNSYVVCSYKELNENNIVQVKYIAIKK